VKRYEELRGFLVQIRPDAAVTVVGRMGPHLTNRARVYKYKHRRPSDYLVFDSRDLKGRTRTDFKKRFDEGQFELVDKQGTFELYRVVSPSPQTE
jgi:hypothetical protein